MAPKKRWNILLADDGSQHALAAVELLQDLPIPLKSHIYLLRAFSPGQIDWLPQFERSLGRSKDLLEARGYRVDAETHLGEPEELILQWAAREHPDLIVMGAKGLRSTLSILLGGVAQHVMEHSYAPVLIVRASQDDSQKVLLPTDGSDCSLEAARYLGRFPLKAGTQVHVLHVLPPEPMPLIMEPMAGTWRTVYATVLEPEVDEAQRKQEEKQGEAILSKTCSVLKRHGIEARRALCRGDAATEIMEYAKSNQIQLIVAGSYGMGHTRTMRLGSVARKLMHYADCSMLLVKMPRKER